MMRLILYHNDADGKCSAAIAGRLAKPFMDPTYQPVSYGEAPPWHLLKKLNPTMDELWVVDFSYSVNEMLKMLCLMGTERMFWFDHHDSKQDLYEQLDKIRGIRDVTRAACLLVWEWCVPEVEPPWPVQYIADRDVWRFKYGDDTRYFYEAYLAEPRTSPDVKLWDRYLLPSDLSKEAYLANGRLLYDARINGLKAMAHRLGHEVLIPETNARVLKMNFPGSGDMGQVVRDMGYDIAWCWHERKTPDGRLVRENNMYSANVNVGAICKARGGGGHKGAAGYVEAL